MTPDEEAAERLVDAVLANVPPLDEDPVAMMLGIVKPYCNLGRGDPAWRGYTRKVGMRKSRLHFDAIRARRVVRPAADAEWAGALLGQMRWPGDPNHGPHGRSCCHTTGPNHHPACQEER